MKLHCDSCNRYLGDYLYGKGGVAEKAVVSGGGAVQMPDVTCFQCLPQGNDLVNTNLIDSTDIANPHPKQQPKKVE